MFSSTRMMTLGFGWSETRRRWLPAAIKGSVRGATTISILRLDEDDHPSWHVEDRVEPAIEELREQMQRGDPSAVRVMWQRKMRSLFAPRQPFHAVTWDALEAAFPADERQRWEVELPRLGTEEEPTSPSAPFADPPERAPLLAALSEDLALRVRAVGDKESPDAMQSLVADLQGLRAWSDEELGRLLGRHPQTIRNYRGMLQAGIAASAAQGTPDEE